MFTPLIVGLWLVLTLPVSQESDPRPLEARVDPRIELMSLIFRLAGNPEYNQHNSVSPYSEAVEKHFRSFADDSVVQTAQALRRRHGVSYDAVMSLAVHLEEGFAFDLALPLDPSPERLDARWKNEDIRQFLRQAQRFAKRTRFADFFRSQRDTFDAAAQRLTDRMAERQTLAWFDHFFGARPRAKFFVIVGMLNGGANYGVSRRSATGEEVLSPVIGAASFDAEGIPIFDSSIHDLIVHEFCHSYTNPIVDRLSAKLDPSAARMYPHCRIVMGQQAYGNPRTMLYESFVRAAEVQFLLETEGLVAAGKEAAYQQQRGFDWVGSLAREYARFSGARDEYPTFESFLPEIVTFFDEVSREYSERMERAPKIESIEPANGTEDVDPATSAIRVTFDRPMRDGRWSVVRTGSGFPQITGALGYDEQRRVLTIPVRLAAGETVRFSLNRTGYMAFVSEEGVPLAPVDVSFTTAQK